MNPLVSVLITVYNREQFIAEAIESVLKSTFTNFELIIVDDNSTDNSFKIAKTYAGNDSRIRLYKNEKNLGQFQNRNKAASLASGKYIKYLDSDDIIYSHGLEVMVNSMERFPEAAFGMTGEINPNRPYPFLANHHKELAKHLTLNAVFIYGPSAMIFKRKEFVNSGSWGTDTYVGTDTEIVTRLSFVYDHVKFPPGLIWWREHSGQEMVKGHLTNEYLFQNLHRNKRIINDAPIEFEVKNLANKKLRNLYISKLLQELKLLRFSNIALLLKSLYKEDLLI